MWVVLATQPRVASLAAAAGECIASLNRTAQLQWPKVRVGKVRDVILQTPSKVKALAEGTGLDVRLSAINGSASMKAFGSIKAVLSGRRRDVPDNDGQPAVSPIRRYPAFGDMSPATPVDAS